MNTEEFMEKYKEEMKEAQEVIKKLTPEEGIKIFNILRYAAEELSVDTDDLEKYLDDMKTECPSKESLFKTGWEQAIDTISDRFLRG